MYDVKLYIKGSDTIAKTQIPVWDIPVDQPHEQPVDAYNQSSTSSLPTVDIPIKRGASPAPLDPGGYVPAVGLIAAVRGGGGGHGQGVCHNNSSSHGGAAGGSSMLRAGSLSVSPEPQGGLVTSGGSLPSTPRGSQSSVALGKHGKVLCLLLIQTIASYGDCRFVPITPSSAESAAGIKLARKAWSQSCEFVICYKVM